MEIALFLNSNWIAGWYGNPVLLAFKKEHEWEWPWTYYYILVGCRCLSWKLWAWGLTCLIKKVRSAPVREAQPWRQSAGLLVTIKTCVHRVWAENPSFLQRGSMLFNSKVLNPPPPPPLRPPLFWDAKAHTGVRLGANPASPVSSQGTLGRWLSFSILTGKTVIKPAPLL